jgi:acyl carrier protein
MNTQRIKKVLSSALGINEDLILETSTHENLDNWDSIKQIDLVVALEEEFSVEFDEDEIYGLNSFKAIYDLISNKLN